MGKGLTTQEKRAVATLRRLAKRWPETLWLFVANGTLNVMACDDSGKRALTADGGMDPAAYVASIEIPSDGGDW